MSEPFTMVAEMVGSDISTNSTTGLTEAARAVVRVARLLEHACTDVTLPQYRLMVMVACGDQRASKLAGRLSLSKPTVTAVVDGLVERGFLARSEVTGDRRAVDLSLTEAGRRALVTSDAAMAARLAWVLEHCDDPTGAEAGLVELAGAVERVVAEKVAGGGK